MRDTHKTETDYASGTLVVTRTYDAGIEDVFDAWVATSKIKEWWGCAQTVKVESEVEPKVGGKYTHNMTLDNGFEVPGEARLFEYDPPNKLAYEAPDEERGLMVQVTVEFTAVGDMTEVKLTHQNIRDEFSQFIIGGWGAAFEKLGAFLMRHEAA